MLYYDVLVDICSQIGDPDMDLYKERAKDHFVRAISELIKAGVDQEDIPYYYKLKTDLSFSSSPYDASALKMLKPIRIFSDPATPKDVLITIVSFDRVSEMARDTDLAPTKQDVFIYQVGTNLYCLVSSSSNFTIASDTLYMVYIKDVDGSAWDDAATTGTDFQGATYYFSYAFTRRCIARAVQTLKEEDTKR